MADEISLLRAWNVINEYGQECLVIHADRKLNASNVTDALGDVFIMRGVP